jgi:hypothetical protein
MAIDVSDELWAKVIAYLKKRSKRSAWDDANPRSSSFIAGYTQRVEEEKRGERASPLTGETDEHNIL